MKKYIEELLRQGKYHFTAGEVVDAVGGDFHSVTRSLHRLKVKGELAAPMRGFYVSVPPEYRALGCLPPEQFVPQLMEKTGEPYHVALLSAAQFHGAAPQVPQHFQVMVRKPRPPIKCGRVRVDFFARKNVAIVSTVRMNTPRGYMDVSSPEATALELVGYAGSAGGLDNVAAVLSELSGSLEAETLVREARKSPLAWSQRLGYLLELVERGEITEKLQSFVAGRAGRIAPLDPSRPRTGAPRSRRWRLAINTKVEPDL